MYVTKNPGMNAYWIVNARAYTYTRNFLYFKITEKIRFIKELTI